MCVASIHLSYVLSIHLAMSIFRLGLMVKQRIGLCGRAWASCACGREEHARASGAGERSAHAAKKVSHGVSAHGAWPVVGRWSNIGLALASGRGILFSSPAKKVHHCLALLPGCLVHNPVFNSFFVQCWVCAHAGG